MKTDIFFHNLFEEQPELALRLAGLPTSGQTHYHFTSIELKEKAHRIDGVLVPDDPALPVVIIEVQFHRDEQMYDRIVSETALYKLQTPSVHTVQMLLFLRSREIDTDAGVWQDLIAGGTLRVIYLDEQTAAMNADTEVEAALLLMRLTVTPSNITLDNAIAQQLRTVIEEMTDTKQQRLFQDLFVSLYLSKYKQLTLEEIRAMMDTRKIFDDIHESVAVQQYAQQYGNQQRNEGKLEGKLEGVANLLRLGLTVEQIAAALTIPHEKVEEIRGSLQS